LLNNRDIVDATPSTGNVLKMLCGVLDKVLFQPPQPESQLLPPLQSPGSSLDLDSSWDANGRPGGMADSGPGGLSAKVRERGFVGGTGIDVSELA
jgi:hypothetical protein